MNPALDLGLASERHGQLAGNIVYLARVLRDAGLPVGPGAVLDGLQAATLTGLRHRQDVRAALHAVFVTRHEHSPVFDQAFALVFRRRSLTERLDLAALAEAPDAPPSPKAGATRVAQAMMPHRAEDRRTIVEVEAQRAASSDESLRAKDFAQMTAAEMAVAEAAIDRLRMPRDRIVSRRFAPNRRGRRLDAPQTFRRTMRTGGIDLAWRAPVEKPPPVVALCDISGSMSDYVRVFLHFLHTLATQRVVHAFLFGTRLTNVSRALRARDIDDALVRVSAEVPDWSGGTRIADSLHRFNRDWSRRVLGGGATVVLFTDGLERPAPGGADLAAEASRLRRSCGRLVWVNPLLRYAAFEPRAAGIRTLLPCVDAFRPIHNLQSIADLCASLSEPDRRLAA